MALQWDFFPFCSANWANLVAMFHIRSNAMEMEGMGTLCGEDRLPVAPSHRRQTYGASLLGRRSTQTLGEPEPIRRRSGRSRCPVTRRRQQGGVGPPLRRRRRVLIIIIVRHMISRTVNTQIQPKSQLNFPPFTPHFNFFPSLKIPPKKEPYQENFSESKKNSSLFFPERKQETLFREKSRKWRKLGS